MFDLTVNFVLPIYKSLHNVQYSINVEHFVKYPYSPFKLSVFNQEVWTMCCLIPQT